MKNPARTVAVMLLGVTLLLTAVNTQAQSKPKTNTKTLTFAVVFQGPRDPVTEHFRPFADYVARMLAPTGDTKGLVVVAPSAAQMMTKRCIDWARTF